jgi:DNA-binding response OmpR family regulator
MKKRIFVVDDEPDVKLALKIDLEEENGFEVDAFDDPIVALDNFTKGVYDLAGSTLTKIMMYQQCTITAKKYHKR